MIAFKREPFHLQDCPKKNKKKDPRTCSYCVKGRRVLELARKKAIYEQQIREGYFP
jgi:hypothetical protein